MTRLTNTELGALLALARWGCCLTPIRYSRLERLGYVVRVDTDTVATNGYRITKLGRARVREACGR